MKQQKLKSLTQDDTIELKAIEQSIQVYDRKNRMSILTDPKEMENTLMDILMSKKRYIRKKNITTF